MIIGDDASFDVVGRSDFSFSWATAETSRVGEVIFLRAAAEDDRAGIGMCFNRSNGNFSSALDWIPMYPAADARKSDGLEALCLCNIQG